MIRFWKKAIKAIIILIVITLILGKFIEELNRMNNNLKNITCNYFFANYCQKTENVVKLH